MTDADSLQNITKQRDEIGKCLDLDTISIFLIGTKTDLSERIAVNRSDAQELADSLALPIYFVSAKTGENVEEVMHFALSCFLSRKSILNQNLKETKNDTAPKRSFLKFFQKEKGTSQQVLMMEAVTKSKTTGAFILKKSFYFENSTD